MVEDEVKEFWDGADALNGGLVHGGSLKGWGATWRTEEGMGVTRDSRSCQRHFSRVAAWITSVVLADARRSPVTKIRGKRTYGLNLLGSQLDTFRTSQSHVHPPGFSSGK